jgi:hypothetical protein
MSLLVRLYPVAWRERYGDELAAILEDRPPGPFDVLDLVLGAVDAHLHLRGPGNHSEHRKGIPMSLRFAGAAAAIGGCLWALFFVLAAISYANYADLGQAWVFVAAIAGLALLAALAGLSAFQFHDHPRAIWFAFLVPAVGSTITLIGLAVIPADGRVDRGTMSALVIYSGLFLVLLGSAIFAAVTVFTGALSRAASGVVIAGAVLVIPGLGGLLTEVWLVVAGIVFGGGWIGLGIDAIRRDRRPLSAGPAAA